MLALACVTGVGRARGDDAAEVSPPRLAESVPPPYPQGAEGEAEVLLELEIDVDGRVVSAAVVSGEEPFASVARVAAERYVFEPARRAGKPLRARIRMAARFVPPPSPPPSSPPPPAPSSKEASAPGASVAAPAPSDAVPEVRVLGQKEPKTPTEHRMGRAEMQVVPGAFGDPFRAIDVHPGLVPIVSGLPYFYVRGAPPSAVGYYIDEVRVPYLFHFALGPGVVQPALVEEVALHPASFPGRYGRYAGGIVAGTTRAPASELYGEGQLRIYDAGAYVEAPFAGGRGSAGVGGRYSYTAALLSLVAPNLTIDYRDYNARVSYALSDRWRATLFTFGSFDFASDDEDGAERVFFASEFHRADLRFDHRGEGGAKSRVAVTLGLDRTRLEDARFAQSVMTNLRARHRRPLSSEVEIEVGGDASIEHYTGDLPSRYAVSRRAYAQAEALFAPRVDSATGAWVSGTYRPAAGWDLTAAMRGDVFTSAGKAAFGPSPRVSVRAPLAPRIAFLGALGIAPQPPAFAVPIPAVGYRGLPGGLAFAYQKSSGLELALPWRFTLKTVGFHHSYFNLRDFAQDRGDVDFQVPQLRPGSPSQAYGLEVSLMRKLSERFSAFGSLTLSRSQLGSRPALPARVSPFDRSYVAQIGGVADLGRGFRASSRFLTYGGWPAVGFDAVVPSDARLPAFHRVDLRLEKRWTFREHRYIGLVLEGLNVTASREIVGRRCSPAGCENDRFGPLVAPSFGVEGAL